MYSTFLKVLKDNIKECFHIYGFRNSLQLMIFLTDQVSKTGIELHEIRIGLNLQRLKTENSSDLQEISGDLFCHCLAFLL